MNTIPGDETNNFLQGTDENDEILGQEGDDTIAGGGGDDILGGGEGFDTLDYSSETSDWQIYLGDLFYFSQGSATDGTQTDINFGFERAVAGSGNDQIIGNGYDNVLEGGAGDDSINGVIGNDVLVGGAGNDILYGGYDPGTAPENDAVNYSAETSDWTINLTDGQATDGTQTDTLSSIEDIIGGSGNDQITGSSFDNLLIGQAGNDTLRGMAGHDVLDGGEDDDILDGGEGIDVVDYSSETTAWTVNLAEGQATNGDQTDTLSNIEIVIGGSGNDYITGDAFDNSLIGQSGNDVLNGMEGHDVLDGGGGDDALDGGEGVDSVDYSSETTAWTVNLAEGQATNGDQTDTLNNIEIVKGGAGNDQIIGNDSDNTFIGGIGNDILNGGSGSDTVSYANDRPHNPFFSGSIDLTIGEAKVYQFGSELETDQLTSIENVIGSQYDDTVIGNNADNSLHGEGGNDSISGGAGDDTLDGGLGNENYVDGGEGIDTLDYQNYINVQVNLTQGSGAATHAVSFQSKTDYVSDIENVIGSDTEDSIVGDDNQNAFLGNKGDDYLSGEGGNDLLDGGIGDDNVQGGAGDDVLIGGTGNNYIDGGEGEDQAIIYGDYITESFESYTRVYTDFGRDKLVSIENIKNINFQIDNATIAEDQPVDSLVGTFSAIGDSLTYKLVSPEDAPDNAYFKLDGSDLKTTSEFDYEDETSYKVAVLATDSHGVTFKKNLTIQVEDVQENGDPTDITLEDNSVSENQPIETVVGTLDAVDPDVDDVSFTYTLVSGAGDTHNDLFAIDGDTLKTNAVFDFEDQKSYEIRVKVEDEHGGSYEESLTVNVEDAQVPSLSLGAPDAVVQEGWPSNNGQFLLKFDDSAEAVPLQVTLKFNETFSTAALNDFFLSGHNVQYDKATGTAIVTLEAGDTEASLNLVATDDLLEEVDETVVFDILSTPDYDADVQGSSTITLLGNDALNRVQGNAQDNLLQGTEGDDLMSGGLGDDNLDALGGHDDLRGGSGNDSLSGGNGRDKLQGHIGSDILHGGEDADELLGGEDDDILNGDAGDDRLEGGAGNDLMSGGTGNDIYVIDSYGDFISEAAEEGIDIVHSSQTNINLRMSEYLENVQLFGNQELGAIGNEEANTLRGNRSRNFLAGEGGNDTLNGGEGDDILRGSGSKYRAFAGTFSEKDKLIGGKGADVFELSGLNGAFYDQNGQRDRALIADFNSLEGDVIALFGNASDYILSVDSTGSSTQVSILKNGDLIGLVRGNNVESLSLDSSAFSFSSWGEE